jgi:hypothetical protein
MRREEQFTPVASRQEITAVQQPFSEPAVFYHAANRPPIPHPRSILRKAIQFARRSISGFRITAPHIAQSA